MGWMSWNIFQDKISETNIKEVADLLVSTGLKEAGFNYILIDDHWHAKKRNTDGTPTYNKSKFPSGFNSLVDYIHAKGLKAGIYSDAAENTCGGEFGGYKYEEIDAIQYAKWGFDFLKYDYCGAPNDVEVAKVRYKTMSDALKNTNRQFFFNICEWGVRKPWLWAAKSGGNAWRVSFDSRDIWDHGKYDNGHCGVIQSIDIIKNLEHYAGPNQFNDADMMCVGLYGNGRPSSASGAKGMTDREYQSQFSLWSMFATPLYISFDLSTMTKATKEILTNKEVIAISQDPMGQQASCIYSENGKEIYMKDLENGDVAVAFLNRNDSDTEMEITLKSLYLKGKHNVRDLVNKQDLKSERNIIKTQVASHEVRLFRLSKK
jgi:alpha-galactosidase